MRVPCAIRTAIVVRVCDVRLIFGSLDRCIMGNLQKLISMNLDMMLYNEYKVKSS